MNKARKEDAPQQSVEQPKTVKFSITLAGPITMYPPDDGTGYPEGCGEYWEGWPSKIPNKYAGPLFEEILKAENLVKFCIKNRWALNRKCPGPRVLKLEYNRVVNFRDGQTATHYYARRCIRCVREGKRAAEQGRIDAAKSHWQQALIAAERLEASFLHALAAREAARIRGQRNGQNAQQGKESRQEVEKILLSLPEKDRYARGLPTLVSHRTGLSLTQARQHIKALNYGATNKKRGA